MQDDTDAQTPQDAAASDHPTPADPPSVDELLEDVSIDGMCGVY